MTVVNGSTWIGFFPFFVSLDDQIARISRMKASIFFVIRARAGPRFCSRQIPLKNVTIKPARESLWYLVKVISSWSLPRLRLVTCPPPSTIYSALKAARSRSTGTRSKRFHLAINGRIATANSSSMRGRTNASRHVWAKIGGAFLSAGIFLDRAWAQRKVSGRADTYAHAKRFSWAYPPYPPRKGLFVIGAPAS